MVKHNHIALISLIIILSMFGLISSDIYIPALPLISHYFQIQEWNITFSLSIYLIALACSQLLYGSVIEKFGHKNILILGIFIYICSSLTCSLVESFNAFLICRLLQGVGAASGLVIGRYLISHHFAKHEIAQIYAIVYPFVSLSPALAPLIGGYLSTYLGWKSNFIFIGLFGFAVLALTIYVLPSEQSHQQLAKSSKNRYLTVFKDGNFWRYTAVVCFIYQAWFVYLTQSTFIFKKVFFLTTQQVGWLYMPLTFGIVIANIATKKLLKIRISDQIMMIGLILFLLGGILFIGSLFMASVSFVDLIIAMFFVSLANGSSLSLAVAAAINSQPQQTAVASGLIGFFQIGSAGLVSYLMSKYFGENLHTLSLSIFTLSVLACLVLGLKQWNRKNYSRA